MADRDSPQVIKIGDKEYTLEEIEKLVESQGKIQVGDEIYTPEKIESLIRSQKDTQSAYTRGQQRIKQLEEEGENIEEEKEGEEEEEWGEIPNLSQKDVKKEITKAKGELLGEIKELIGTKLQPLDQMEAKDVARKYQLSSEQEKRIQRLKRTLHVPLMRQVLAKEGYKVDSLSDMEIAYILDSAMSGEKASNVFFEKPLSQKTSASSPTKELSELAQKFGPGAQKQIELLREQYPHLTEKELVKFLKGEKE